MKKESASMRKLRGKVRTQNTKAVEFKTHKATQPGSIMKLAKARVVTIRREDTVLHAAQKMNQRKIRRLFVTDSEDRFLGLVEAQDILDFLGGGERARIVKNRYRGKMDFAIETKVRTIMTRSIPSVDYKASIKDALTKMKRSGRGCVPILKNKKLFGVVTERDFLRLISKQTSTEPVRDHMTKPVIFGSPMMRLPDVAKVMFRNGFRRLPILQNGKLYGIVTNRDLVAYFSRTSPRSFGSARVHSLVRVPETTTPDDLLVNAAEHMRKKNIGGMPVMENNLVVGILTEKDLLRAIDL